MELGTERMKGFASPYRPLLQPCKILVRAVRHHSVLSEPIPVDPRGTIDEEGIVKCAVGVQANALVSVSGAALWRQPVHRVLPYRRGRGRADDLGDVVGGGGDVGGEAGGHEPRPEIWVGDLRARREHLGRRRATLAAPVGIYGIKS